MKLDIYSNKRLDKIKIKMKGNYFGFAKLSSIFAVILTFLIIMQYFYYYILAPKGDKITNLMKVYILAVELWSSFATIHSVFFQTILWNNTVPVWDHDSLTAFNFYKDHIQKNILVNFTEALEYNLGNYTELFETKMTKVRIIFFSIEN